MSNNTNVALWEARTGVPVSDATTSVPQIVGAAKQLRERERLQIINNLTAGNFEVAATFIWHRSMALLKKQLAHLGNEFISELLQRPDIDEHSDISTAVSEAEAISLARDLGMLTPTQAMRLVHSQEVVNHFASIDGDDNLSDDEIMTPEEAISCLRICVQSILGHERISVAEDFATFRRSLESRTFTSSSPEIIRLQQSPYFFVRTAISILLSVLKGGKGAQLEHAARNALLTIPMFWSGLKKPERWQVGQAYAEEFNEGHSDSVRALHAVLVAVKGFDYVPENLRSNTFTKVAASVITAHQGSNNFYNEPAPMRELANLGSSIPSPALAACITAAICVKLGNQYGISWAAQPYADQVLNGISKDRWIYYLDGRLEQDLIILPKLCGGPTLNRWISLVRGIDLDPKEISSKDVQSMIVATIASRESKVSDIARKLLQNSK